MTTCVRCADTAGPFELVDGEGWVHLFHLRRLVVVPDDPTPLEGLLLASLTARDGGRLLSATHNALARNAMDDVVSQEVWPVEVGE